MSRISSKKLSALLSVMRKWEQSQVSKLVLIIPEVAFFVKFFCKKLFSGWSLPFFRVPIVFSYQRKRLVRVSTLRLTPIINYYKIVSEKMSTYFFQIHWNYTTIRDGCQDFLKNLRFHASCGRHWYNYSEVGGGCQVFLNVQTGSCCWVSRRSRQPTEAIALKSYQMVTFGNFKNFLINPVSIRLQ